MKIPFIIKYFCCIVLILESWILYDELHYNDEKFNTFSSFISSYNIKTHSIRTKLNECPLWGELYCVVEHNELFTTPVVSYYVIEFKIMRTLVLKHLITHHEINQQQ